MIEIIEAILRDAAGDVRTLQRLFDLKTALMGPSIPILEVGYMAFPPKDVQALLAACHRRCCICHRFCGYKIETDHMKPSSEGGTDDIENAIAVCFECHAEIHSYNVNHPRGRRFRPEELQRHKEEWLRICRERPEALVNAPRNSDVGPLQAMIDELEFNAVAVGQNLMFINGSKGVTWPRGATFLHDHQFRDSIRMGAIAILNDDLRKPICEAYCHVGKINQLAQALAHQSVRDQMDGGTTTEMRISLEEAKGPISNARDQLLKFLGRDGTTVE